MRSRLGGKKKRRTQRVRFRPRYASSVLHQTAQSLWQGIKITLILCLLIGCGWGITYFWNHSSLIRIDDIRYQGDIPAGLPRFLSINKGKNILLLPTRRLTKEAQQVYPELEELAIRRHWDQSVSITGKYRMPLSYWEDETGLKAIDKNGILFELPIGLSVPEHLPIVRGTPYVESMETVAQSLSLVKTKSPEFWKRFQSLEIEPLGQTKITLVDDILIYWGEIQPQTILPKAERVEKLLSEFHPTGTLASLRFVRENRIILDSHWEKN